MGASLVALGGLGTADAGARPAAQAAGAGCVAADSTPGKASVAQLRGAVACLLRAERRRWGLGGLRTDAHLGRAASGYASRMVALGFFAHVDPAGGTLPGRLRAAGFIPRSGGWAAGEVLGRGTRSAATPRSLVRGWLNSPPHRAILRDGRFDRLGVGLARGTPRGADGLTAAVEFGRR